MSSEVHAKWKNSPAAATSDTSAKRFLSQYSTALTSWLVTASMPLTSSASSAVKPSLTESSSATVAAENGATSGIRSEAANAFNHSISTRIRFRIRPNSEKCRRKDSVLDW